MKKTTKNHNPSHTLHNPNISIHHNSLRSTPNTNRRNKTNTLCRYTSTATYDYIATLEPNTIYNNKTTLTPEEGTLYTKITKQINITLTYTFHTTIPSDATITHSLTQTLTTTAWTYTLNQTTPTTTTKKQSK